MNRKRTFLSLWFFLSLSVVPLTNVALAGPGSSGGNPTHFIMSPRDNFVFSSVAPTDVRPSAVGVTLDYSLIGYQLHVTPVTQSVRLCPVNGYRNVCVVSSDWTQRELLVVFADGSTFSLVFKDTGIGPERLEQYSERTVATFSQGVSVSNNHE